MIIEYNLSLECVNMGSTFLNLIWNHYINRDGIINYLIEPNEDKEMIAKIIFKDEESKNKFDLSVFREIKIKKITK